MPHIPIEEHLPGITGLLEYRQDSAAPIRELTQFLLRGPNTLTAAERELIATVVSHANGCHFCTQAHTAAVDRLLGESATAAALKADPESEHVSDKTRTLLLLARQVQKGGDSVTPAAIARAKSAGANDREIHDTVLIAALFCLYNRYVDGLATVAPESPEFYGRLGDRLVQHGYARLPQGYDHLRAR